MRYHEIVRENVGYITVPPPVVYHGSKTPSIKKFEYRDGIRAGFFDEYKVKANGFFFALTPDDAASFGPYVGCYRITCHRPLISGTEGVDRIQDPKKIEDFLYIFAGMLKEDGEGHYQYQGMTRMIGVDRADIQDPQSSWFYEFIGAGGIDWECLDNPEFVRRMRERGYDGTVVYEPDTEAGKSWFVVSPEQIEYLGEYEEPREPELEEDDFWD